MMSNSYQLRRLRSIPKWNSMCTISYKEFKKNIIQMFLYVPHFRYKYNFENQNRYFIATLYRKTKDNISEKVTYNRCKPNGIVLITEDDNKPPRVVGYKSFDELYKIYCKSGVSSMEGYTVYFTDLLEHIPLEELDMMYDGENFIQSNNKNDELYFELLNEIKLRFSEKIDENEKLMCINIFNEAYILMKYLYGDDVEKYIYFISIRIMTYVSRFNMRLWMDRYE